MRKESCGIQNFAGQESQSVRIVSKYFPLVWFQCLVNVSPFFHVCAPPGSLFHAQEIFQNSNKFHAQSVWKYESM